MLLVSAVIVALAGEWSTAVVFVVLVSVNAGIGGIQEYKAQRTMDSLQRLVHAEAAVIRDGVTMTVPTADLVVGDVVIVGEGDSVPADLRLTEVDGFATNEFALTGESGTSHKSTTPVDGNAPLAERSDSAFSGTLVATGEAQGLVTATGARTELGKIADLTGDVPQPPGPLQKEMATITKTVGLMVVTITAVLLVVAVGASMSFLNALLFAVGLAAALIPQGLPAEVNTALAGASAALARQNVLVKQLNSVETLGCTSVICTDKTGTLTRNEMTVTDAVVGGVPVAVTGTGYGNDGELRGPDGVLTVATVSSDAVDLTTGLGAFLAVGAFASTADILPPDADHPDRYVLGDPTEACLLPLAAKGGLDPDRLREGYDQVRVLTFDSERRRMTSVRLINGTPVAYVKGSPDVVAACATRVLVGGPDGTVRECTDADRASFLDAADSHARRGLRTLAVAVRTDVDPTGDVDAVECDLTLLGLVAMIDPLRDEVTEAMDLTHRAGIAVNIVTGDSAFTASTIAHQAHLAGGRAVRTVAVAELHDMTDAEVLTAASGGGTVFSRVAPADKMRIVTLLRDSGRVVAVTGDGINDAPALKAADIGVAMGRTGTDVAKDAADLVLLDDSYPSLVTAVRQGRRIYANVRKGVLSCLTSNVGEFVVNGVGLLLYTVAGVPLPIPVTLLLAIDVLGEILPIAALGGDPEEGETLTERPRDPDARILTRWTMLDLALTGLVMGLLALGGYLLAWVAQGVSLSDAGDVADADPGVLAAATTVTYVTVLCTQLAAIIHRRSTRGVFTRYQLSNRLFWAAVAAAVIIMLAIVHVPGLQDFFSAAPLPPVMWLYVMASVAVIVAARTVIVRVCDRSSHQDSHIRTGY